jgi:hypothetical protein
MAVRVKHYTTTLPVGKLGRRRTIASATSMALHVLLLAFLISRALTQRQQAGQPAAQTVERPIQLVFAPPRPKPTPRPVAAQTPPEPPPPAVPLTPGPDQTPGSRAQVTPTPEPEPNASPESRRTEATRPDPGTVSNPGTATVEQPPASIAAQPSTATSKSPTLESEAQRLFGRPSSKLGPVSGQRDNRPWETPVELSRGCSLPPDSEATDSTLPKGMAAVSGRIFREGTNEPLAGARLQILGTQYGTFSNSRGEYRLIFARNLVDRCRTQSVRVTAPGYGQRDVILSLGERVSSDVWLPRY